MVDLIDKSKAVFWGEFVQVAYQMFDDDKTALNPPQPSYFPAGWELRANINMTHGIIKACRSQTTSPTELPDDPELIGFIARKKRSAEYAVVFRGTDDLGDLETDLQVRMVSAVKGLRGRTEEGFTRMYESMCCRNPTNVGTVPVSGNGADLMSDARSVTVAGHSLGAALAVLHGCMLACTGRFPDLKVCTLAAPKVGDDEFARHFDALVPQSVRVYNLPDPIPHFPWFESEYRQVQTGFEIDSLLDPEISLWVTCSHALRTYLRVLGSTKVPLGSCAAKDSGETAVLRDALKLVTEIMRPICRRRHNQTLGHSEVLEADRRLEELTRSFEARAGVFSHLDSIRRPLVREAEGVFMPMVKQWRSTLERDLSILAPLRKGASTG